MKNLLPLYLLKDTNILYKDDFFIYYKESNNTYIVNNIRFDFSSHRVYINFTTRDTVTYDFTIAENQSIKIFQAQYRDFRKNIQGLSRIHFKGMMKILSAKTLMEASTEYLCIYNLLIIKTTAQLYFFMQSGSDVFNWSLNPKRISEFNIKHHVDKCHQVPYCNAVVRDDFCYGINVFTSSNSNSQDIETKIAQLLNWKKEIMENNNTSMD